MSNPFYVASGNPGTRAQGASQAIRTEFQSIEDAFDMFPTTLTANKAVIVNAGGTGLTLTTGSLALAGNFTTVGAYAVTLTATNTTTLTLPLTGTLSTLAGAETLTNKTITSPTISSPTISGGTLTGPTINGATISGTFAGSITFSGAVTLGSTLTYGGVTLSAAVTGTGSMVLSASPTFTGTVTGVAATFTGSITANGYLYSNTGTGAMARVQLQNTNRTWTISNYGTSFSPNGRLAIADETAGATYFTIDVGGAATAHGTLTVSGTTTLSSALTYGGVALSNSVTGTGSMVLSASPTFTGTVSGSIYNFTTGDTAVGGRITGASGKIRLWGYFSGASTIDAAVSSEATYGPLRVTGNPLYLAGNGVDVVSVTSSLLTTTVALNYGGVTLSNSVTGTGSMVLSASPTFTGTLTAVVISASGSGTFTSPNSGSSGGVVIKQNAGGGSSILQFVNSAASVEFGNIAVTSANLGTLTFTGGISIPYALTYGGVTLSNSVTGTGSMVLSTSPSFGGTVVYSSMTGSNIYTTAGVMQMSRDSSTGGGLLFIDSAVGGQNWQAGPGSGSGNKDYWAIYNFGTTTTVLNIHKTGAVSTPVSLTTPTFNSTSSYQFNGATLALVTGTYTVLYDGSARQNLFLGGTGDQTNYYRNSVHYFQTVAGAANILNMTSTLATFAVPLNYGGVTLSNAVTGTGSMVLSASPTFTGTVNANTVAMTGSDSQPIGYIYSASGMIRLWGYTSSATLIDACTANQASYIAMRLTGTSIYLSSSGTDKLTVTSSGVTFGSAAMATPSGSAPLGPSRAWVEWTGGGTTINSSMNVSSITRNAGGSYYVNFTTAAPNATYATVASGDGGTGVFVGAAPNTTARAFVYSANTVTQTAQDANPYSCVCYW